MSYTLIFLAMLMAVVVWWLVKQSINVTPWSAHQNTEQVRSQGVRSTLVPGALPPAKVALGVFLAVVTSLFALFISAYSIRMEYGDWQPLTEPGLLWANSGILLLSSILLQMAWNAARRDDDRALKLWLSAGALMGVIFVAAQLAAWLQLVAAGDVISANPANGFFYLLTGVHALHLIGGLIALGKCARRVWGAQPQPEAVLLGMELCAVYWHYLLVVWVILFSLMLST